MSDDPDERVELLAKRMTHFAALGAKPWEDETEEWRDAWRIMARDLIISLEDGGYSVVPGRVFSRYVQYRVGGLRVYSRTEAEELGDGSAEEQTVTAIETPWRPISGS